MWKCIHIQRALWTPSINPLSFLIHRANTAVKEFLAFIYQTKKQEILQLLVMQHCQLAEFYT